MKVTLQDLLNSLGALSFDQSDLQGLQYHHGIDIDEILKKLGTILASNSERKKQLHLLIFLGLIKGNMIDKIYNSISQRARLEFRSAVAAFRIKSKPSLGVNKSTTLTLARLRIAVPQCAALYLSKPEVIRPVSMVTLNQLFGSDTEKFPLIFRDRCIASLIPTKNIDGFTKSDREDALVCIQGYCFLESNVIGKRGKSPTENLADTIKYMKYCHESSHVTPEMRMKFVKKYLLELSYHEVAAKVAAYLEPYKSDYTERNRW